MNYFAAVPLLAIVPGRDMNDSRTTHIVLYDDQCPLCTFQMRVITWLDWLNAVSLLPICDSRAAVIAPSLTRDALIESIHCVAKDGRVYRGARCLRFIGMRMPLAIPVVLFLWFPGVIWIAERIYLWVSRHRHLLSRMFGCKEACALVPARRRANEKELQAK
jgi:predicted DCC family thiol-disulfide oxidoreductase YuxK